MVSLNLYRAPDDIYRVHSLIKDIQKKSAWTSRCG
jgi:hypothetical protein